MRILLLFVCSIVFAQQKDYPQDYFVSPLDIPLHLSGSFGELRNNHFHSGLDFKTKQQTGLPVYAAADGFVSRIKVSTWGYGKAIYVTHPNGYTTVYGHLEKFAPEIEAYIKQNQYKEKSFEVECFPRASEFKIKQGQLIALSGNTGGSGGPHLHFEIRDSKTENIINPMFFGFDKLITDTYSPTINSIYVYPIGEESYANDVEQVTAVNLTLQKDGNYIAQSIQANGKIGFGLDAYDMFDFNYNKNGIYSIETFINGSPDFSVVFDEFAFSETRYLNAFIDYAKLATSKARVQKLFIENPYPLSLVNASKKNGIITPLANLTLIYKIVVSDFHQNKTSITIPINYTRYPLKVKRKVTKTGYFLKHKIDNLYEKDKVSVYVPSGVFYNDFDLIFDIQDNILTFADKTIPVHKNYSITIKDTDIPDSLRSKTYIASIQGKALRYNKTSYTNDSFKTYTRNTGQFMLTQDTIAPSIRPINFSEGQWITNLPVLKVSITDDASGIDTYNAYLNGEWILMEYDYKTNRLVHDFADQKVKDGRNEIKIIVRDNVGNSSIFETHFFRLQKK